jgi:hypothetical protein
LVKKGEGDLVLKDTAGYQGHIRLREGTLKVPQRAIPSALPQGMYLHFDASGISSLSTTIEDTDEYVDTWRSIADSVFWSNSICARSSGANRPLLRRNELGEGKHVVDFGRFFDSMNGKYMTFATNETSAISDVDIVVPHVMTIVALMGAQHGGGNLVGKAEDNYFRRQAQFPSNYTGKVYTHTTLHSKAYIDGVFSDNSTLTGFATPGYQAYALVQSCLTDNNDKSKIKYIASCLNKSGGMRIAELAVYNRALTDREICDAHAYLLDKWLSRTAPGYALGEDSPIPALQNIMSDGGSVFVPEDETLFVGRVAGSVDLVKTGPGVLKVCDNALDSGAKIVALEGDVEITDTRPDVGGVSEVASNPSLHLASDDVNFMELVEKDDETLVPLLYDLNNRNAALRNMMDDADTAFAPALVRNGFASKNYLDFKVLGKTRGARFMSLARVLDSVRSAFVVWKPYSNPEGVTTLFPTVLGSTGNAGGFANVADFLRQNGYVFSANDVAGLAAEGEIRINGTKEVHTKIVETDVWQLHEYHTLGGSHVSAIGSDRGIESQCGGFALAEVILYERVLSEREKTATRNYLNKKWFGKTDDQLEPLPGIEANVIANIDVSGDVKLANADSVRVNVLAGKGVFAKTGTASLSIDDWSAFTGTVKIAKGTVSLSKKSPHLSDGAGEMVEDGLIYRADSSSGLLLVTNDAGRIDVKEWKSALDDGWAAYPMFNDSFPTMVDAPELNGVKVVDMAREASQGLVFKKDGVQKPLENIRSIFWMIGSQNGGGLLMGGGTNAANSAQRYNFHRNISTMPIQPSYGLVNNHAQAEVVGADWRINETAIAAGRVSSTGLSGEWDVLSMNFKEGAVPTQAEGFAFDGRTLGNASTQLNRVGGQRLAEVLVYNRRLTAEEVVSVEKYLIGKWKYKVQRGIPENVRVDIATGATLDLGGFKQEVAAVSGGGTIANGTLVPYQISVDSSGVYPVSTAAVELPDSMIIDLGDTDLSGVEDGLSIPVLKASSVTGLENKFVYIADGKTSAVKFSASWDSSSGILSVNVTKLALTIFVK